MGDPLAADLLPRRGLPPPPRSIVDHSSGDPRRSAARRPVRRPPRARSRVGASRSPPIRIGLLGPDGDRAVADSDDAVPDQASRRSAASSSTVQAPLAKSPRSSTAGRDLVGRRVGREEPEQAGAPLVGVVAEMRGQARPASSSRCRGSRRAPRRRPRSPASVRGRVPAPPRSRRAGGPSRDRPPAVAGARPPGRDAAARTSQRPIPAPSSGLTVDELAGVREQDLRRGRRDRGRSSDPGLAARRRPGARSSAAIRLAWLARRRSGR